MEASLCGQQAGQRVYNHPAGLPGFHLIANLILNPRNALLQPHMHLSGDSSQPLQEQMFLFLKGMDHRDRVTEISISFLINMISSADFFLRVPAGQLLLLPRAYPELSTIPQGWFLGGQTTGASYD